MSNIEYDDILFAVRVIRDTCKEHSECESCPVNDEYFGCVISNVIPEQWNIMDWPEITHQSSRVFKPLEKEEK